MKVLVLVPGRSAGKHLADGVMNDWPMAQHQQIDRVPSDSLDWVAPRLALSQWDGGFSPSVDVSEDNRKFELTAALPGFEREDVEISLSDGVLKIMGEMRSKAGVEHSRERNLFPLQQGYGVFRRDFQFPPETVADQVSASFNDSVLRVTVMKKHGTETARFSPPNSGLQVAPVQLVGET